MLQRASRQLCARALNRYRDSRCAGGVGLEVDVGVQHERTLAARAIVESMPIVM
jgi:hypothetical protein